MKRFAFDCDVNFSEILHIYEAIVNRDSKKFKEKLQIPLDVFFQDKTEATFDETLKEHFYEELIVGFLRMTL